MSSGMGGLVEAAQGNIGQLQPQSGGEFERELASWPDGLREVGQAFAAFAQRCSGDLPVEPGTVAAIEQLAATISGLGDVAEEIYSTHRAEHERELRRIEDPRPGEEMWDRSAE